MAPSTCVASSRFSELAADPSTCSRTGRLERVPNQSGAVPSYPLPFGYLLARHLGREGFARAELGRRDDLLLVCH